MPELGCDTGRVLLPIADCSGQQKMDPHRNICRYLPKEAVDKIAQNFTANHLSDSPEWKVG